MIVPNAYYQRIVEIEERFEGLFTRSLAFHLASGMLEYMLRELPEDEQQDALHLLEKSVDNAGMKDNTRLTDEEQVSLSEKIRKAAALVRDGPTVQR